MTMKIIPLKENQFAYFRGMDPFLLAERKDVPATIRVGAFAEEEGGAMPASLMLATVKGHEFMILWLFTSPAYRRRGFGEALLYQAAVAAEKKKCTRMLTSFFPTFGRSAICRGETAFFEAHGFRKVTRGLMAVEVSDYLANTEFDETLLEESGSRLYDLFGETDPAEYLSEENKGDTDPAFPDETVRHKNWKVSETDLAACLRLPFLGTEGQMSGTTGEDGCKSTGDLFPEELEEGIRSCVAAGRTGFVEGIGDVPIDYFDLSVSCCRMEENRMQGLLLLHFDPGSKTAEVDLLYVAQERDLETMLKLIRFSVLKAKEEWPADTRIVIPNEEERHKALIFSIFRKKI